ncbi:DUF6471 domain-containing protein [Burkholderia pseudomallei]|uniref:DUF6471 domain-containing protein n=2 Tax=Burkholderia pseudomallei TaxID=28450 RepID=UPI0028E0A24D|nr:DUF6471 domain-containing protein [Burkholderia pseudomallei]
MSLAKSESVDWQREARRLLRAQMALRDVRYKGLARALETVGVHEDPKALANKINRGTFSCAFFLQCLRALDIDAVRVKDL